MVTGAELEVAFAAGNLQRIGDGSRRICYRLPGTQLCVKSYRSEAELDTRLTPDGVLEHHAPRPSVIREIRKHRFTEENTSCQEWHYFQTLRTRLPKHLLDVFPDVFERVLVPSRGWCLVENEIVNVDGSKPHRLSHAYRMASETLKSQLLARFRALIDCFAQYAVRFYDPQNVLVQRVAGDARERLGADAFAGEGFRLRIVDFEPATRTFLPIDLLGAYFVRLKVYRRAQRYLREHLHVK